MVRETNEIVNKFTDLLERKTARTLYQKYMADYAIETVSDTNTLGEIIYLEVIQTRLQSKLNQMYASEAKAVPAGLVDIIHKNSEAILKLKNSLGLNKAKESKSLVDRYNQLMRRAKQWQGENQASRTIKCPSCLEFILLRIRTEAWEAQKHPFFKDTILYNKTLFEKYYKKPVIVDENFIAEVLETSSDYVRWVKGKARYRRDLNEETPEKESLEEESSKEIETIQTEEKE